jgi:hypothetical protein
MARSSSCASPEAASEPDTAVVVRRGFGYGSPVMRLALAAAVLVSGCRDPEIVEVRLVTEPGLRPARDFATVVLCVSVAGERDCVVRSEFEGGAIGTGADLFDPTLLVEEETYELRVWADFDASAPIDCANEHAVGRSLPFEHRAPPYAITVQVGCANEFTRTRAQPIHARLAHTIVPRRSGDAIIAAGAQRVVTPMSTPMMPSFPRYEGPVLQIERYDPTTGRFEEILGLPSGRWFAGGLELRDGSVVIAGGQISSPAAPCTDDFEIVYPPGARRSGELAAPRCGPALVRMSSGLLIAGSGVLDGTRVSGAERHGPAMNGVPVAFTGGDIRALSSAIAIGGGEYVLIVGGQQAPTAPLFELASNDGLAPFPIEERALPLGWTGPSATYVPCDAGGGAVFLAGGDIGGRTTDALYCFADVLGGAVSPLPPLAIPRQAHQAAHVTIDGVDHLLLAGGSNDTAVLDDFELVPVDACACTATVERPPMGLLPDDGTFFVAHSLERLADGTALLFGGVTMDSEMTRIDAVASALLFYPDFARP